MTFSTKHITEKDTDECYSCDRLMEENEDFYVVSLYTKKYGGIIQSKQIANKKTGDFKSVEVGFCRMCWGYIAGKQYSFPDTLPIIPTLFVSNVKASTTTICLPNPTIGNWTISSVTEDKKDRKRLPLDYDEWRNNWTDFIVIFTLALIGTGILFAMWKGLSLFL